jgi:hypothetical protein
MEAINNTMMQLKQGVHVVEDGQHLHVDRVYTWGKDCGWVIFIYTRNGHLYARRPWSFSTVK